jgi:hypothetical protein
MKRINEDKSPIDFRHYDIEYLNGELMNLLGADGILSLPEFIDAIESAADEAGLENEPEVVAGWFAGLILDEDTFEAICDEESVGTVKKCVENIKKGTFDKYIEIYQKSPKKLYDILKPYMNEAFEKRFSKHDRISENDKDVTGKSLFPKFAQFINEQLSGKRTRRINEDKSPIDYRHYDIEYLNGELMNLLGADGILSLPEFIDAIESAADEAGLENEPEVVAGWFAGLILDEDTFEAICDEESVGTVKKCVENIKKGTFDKYIEIYQKSPKKLYDILKPYMNEAFEKRFSKHDRISENDKDVSLFPKFAQFINETY